MKCVCVWLGAGGELIRGLGWGFNNHVGTGGMLGVFLCCDGVEGSGKVE